jgi:hypothetical protein
MRPKQRVHDKQVGCSRRGVGLAGNGGRHEPAVAGKPARATADPTNRRAVLDTHPFSTAVIE